MITSFLRYLESTTGEFPVDGDDEEAEDNDDDDQDDDEEGTLADGTL